MNQTSRRNFLRGAGVALTLPWMESLSRAATEGNKPPLRFGCVYFSNGIKPAHWWAKGAGASIEFGPSAAPLAAIREDIVFLHGLYNHQAFTNPSPHMLRTYSRVSELELVMTIPN